MATANYSAVLAIVNQTGLHKTNPPLYASLRTMMDTGNLVITQFNADIASLVERINNTFTFGTSGERANYKPEATVGNLVFFFETDTGRLYVFLNGENTWFPVGAPVDATYLTWTDQSTTLPNSRWLKAGSGITFDDTVANIRTISSTGGDGLVAMCTGENPAVVLRIGQRQMLIHKTSAR